MIVIAILGLLVPGYALARALRSPLEWAVAAAFPLSALLLAVTVIAFALAGIPIRFGYVFASIAVATLLSMAIAYRRGRDDAHEPGADMPQNRAPRWLVVLVGVQVGFVLVGILVRTSLYPLVGYD